MTDQHEPRSGPAPSPELAHAVREVIRRRRSVRVFEDRAIPRGTLLELVEAGVYAPSGSNAQNQRFLIVDDRAEIERIGAIRWVLPYRTRPGAARRERKPYGILGNAAALIFVFADAALTDTRESGEYFVWEALEIQSCAASIQNMLLMAAARGIATCWISCSEGMAYSRLLSGRSWREVFRGYNIPPTCKIQACVMVGYPKSVDEDGFPKGEAKHGVAWGTVERRPVEHYLLTPGQPERDPLGPAARVRVALCVRMIRVLLRALNRLNLVVSRLELPKVGRR